jgi:ABC-2 type transport system ATP-binding protein
MWQIIADLAAHGVTNFLTTQYLEEADQLADRIAVLDHGKLVAQGTAGELKRLVAGGHVLLRFGSESALDRAAALFGSAAGRDDETLTLQIPSDGGVRSLKDLLDRLDQHGIDVETLTVHTPDLDDVFLAITGSQS